MTNYKIHNIWTNMTLQVGHAQSEQAAQSKKVKKKTNFELNMQINTT